MKWTKKLYSFYWKKCWIALSLCTFAIPSISQEREKISDCCSIPTMLYFPKSNVLFVNIPKNASTFIRTSFVEKGIWLTANDMSEELKKGAIKLVVVRNPYSRAISSYLEIMKLRRDGPYQTTASKDFYQNKGDLHDSFDSFLLELKKEDGLYDQHACPQSVIFQSKGIDLSTMDFIIDFDCLVSDLAVFQEIFKISLRRGKPYNSHKEKKASLYDYVEHSEATRKAIEEVYWMDFLFYQQALERRKKLLESN